VPYLYVFTIDDFGYILEATCIAGKYHDILLCDALNMVNNHFNNDSLLSVSEDQDLVYGALAFLDTFSFILGVTW
jgi:hypothetical protein